MEDDPWWTIDEAGIRSAARSRRVRSIVVVSALTAAPVDLAFKLLDDSSSTPLKSLQTYFRSLPTQTAVHSSIQTLIRVLLLHIAQSTNSSHVLLGTSLTSLAISLISGISQGGGYNVREETQEDWTPPLASTGGKERAIKLVRPLRDVGVKECGIDRKSVV